MLQSRASKIDLTISKVRHRPRIRIFRLTPLLPTPPSKVGIHVGTFLCDHFRFFDSIYLGVYASSLQEAAQRCNKTSQDAVSWLASVAKLSVYCVKGLAEGLILAISGPR